MTSPTLTESQAYAAMFLFLDARWHRLPGDALGSLLGEMCLVEGSPADPAIREDWLIAVDRALNGEPAADLKLS